MCGCVGAIERGMLSCTGAERAEQAEARLRETESLLEQQQRAEHLAEQLRALGVAPDRLEET